MSATASPILASGLPAGLSAKPSFPLLEQLLLPLQSMVNFFSPPIPAQTPGLHTPSSTAVQILRSRRTQDGRLVISGRMHDVCAELDRLCQH
jgi:uncharacterized protein involved in exopolysaccharide biosynthesis